jgi:hypothetical protein
MDQEYCLIFCSTALAEGGFDRIIVLLRLEDGLYGRGGGRQALKRACFWPAYSVF